MNSTEMGNVVSGRNPNLNRISYLEYLIMKLAASFTPMNTECSRGDRTKITGNSMDEAKKTALCVDCDRLLKWALHAPGVASVLGYYCYAKGIFEVGTGGIDSTR